MGSKNIVLALLCFIMPFMAISQTANFRRTDTALVVTDNGNILRWKNSDYYKNSLLLKSDKNNFINIKDFGAKGDGVFDNTTIINNALSTYKEVYFPEGNYLVTSLVNASGSTISGKGVVFKNITGGRQRLNIGNDNISNFFGQEYLSFFQRKQLQPDGFLSNSIKILWSGDSTTEGASVSSSFTLDSLFHDLCEKKGISNVTNINRGHSSMTSIDWRNLYVANDLNENPDLYIVRWGANDPYFGVTPDTFRSNLRSVLDSIRSVKTVSQMSILLMSPNTMSDTPNGRDEKWFEEIDAIIRQAARDYKCAFIDTYHLWLDSRQGSAGLYMDDPYGDGRAIHPLNVMNTWIAGSIFDFVFPTSYLAKVSDSYVYNQSYLDRLPGVNDSPATYKKGLSINRATAANGWTNDGTVFSFYNRDFTGGQFNVTRLTQNPSIRYRSINFGIGEGVPLSWSNSVELFHSGNSYSKSQVDSVGNVTLQKAVSNGNTATSQIRMANNTDIMFGSTSGIGLYFNSTEQELTFYRSTLGDNTLTINRNNGNVSIPVGKLSVFLAPTNPTDVVRLGDLSGYELLSNKQNSLVADGTNTKYPTVTAVNAGLALKANLSGGNTFTGDQTMSTGSNIIMSGTSGIRGASGFTLSGNANGSNAWSIVAGNGNLASPGGKMFFNSANGITWISSSTSNTKTLNGSSAFTGNYTIDLPDESGVVALKSDIPQLVEVSGTTQALQTGRTYIFHNTSTTQTASLPANPSVNGGLITIIVDGVGRLKITQGANQYIVSGNATSTVGVTGYVQTNTDNTTITIRYVNTNKFMITSSNSTPTIF